MTGTRVGTLSGRLQELAERLNQRCVIERAADDSARPVLEVTVPVREIAAVIAALAEAADALRDDGEL